MYIIFILAILFGHNTHAETSFGSEGINIPVQGVKFDKRLLDPRYDFEGIAKLSNCSGAVVQFDGQPDSDKAYVLTNGHCIQKRGGYLQPGEVVTNLPFVRSVGIYNNENKLIVVKSETLIYATMTKTDSAIYRLEKSYDELLDMGIESYILSDSRPQLGTAIEIVSGYWDRGYTCYIDAFVPFLLEGGWSFTDSIRYSSSGCDTIGGTSGSPIIEAGTRIVIGVNNTGNKNGGRCTLNNPCERDEMGEITVYKRSYGQQTYEFYSCLTEQFEIDTKLEGCLLPK